MQAHAYMYMSVVSMFKGQSLRYVDVFSILPYFVELFGIHIRYKIQ